MGGGASKRAPAGPPGRGTKRKKNDPRYLLEKRCEAGDVPGVSKLLSAAKDLLNGALDDDGTRALMVACRCGQEGVVKELMKRDASARPRRTPAKTSTASSGTRPVLRSTSLRPRHRFLNQRNEAGATALMFAAAGGFEKICKMVLDAGGDVRIVDRDKKSALEYAQLNGQSKVENLLQLYACEYTW